MKRHLTWIIAGTATVGLAVPAFAGMQSASPDDNVVPSEIRSNCDEAEHANDRECLTVASRPTSPSTLAVPVGTSPSTTADTSTTSPDSTVAQDVPIASTDDRPTGSIPSTSVSASPPLGTVPALTVPSSVAGDVSGPCDEAEHVNDPRCTGSTAGDDSSGRGSDDDGSDDRSGRGSDD